VLLYFAGAGFLLVKRGDTCLNFLSFAIYITSQVTATAASPAGVSGFLGGTAALGSFMLGTLVGDAVLGVTFLICSPVIGWVVLIITGITVGYLISKYSKEVVEWTYDVLEYADNRIAQEIDKAIEYTHKLFVDAWNMGASWLPVYYGDKSQESK
jgi:hypothetical protein